MKKSLSHWLIRDLTIFGRTILSKAEGISKLIYPCHSVYISSDNIKKANTLIFQFLWRNKTHYIRRTQLVKDYDKGGIKFHIPRSLFEETGGLDFILKRDYDVSRIPIKLSNFHKQVLLFLENDINPQLFSSKLNLMEQQSNHN